MLGNLLPALFGVANSHSCMNLMCACGSVHEWLATLSSSVIHMQTVCISACMNIVLLHIY